MNLSEELKDLTDALEKILHEELPEAARLIERNGSGSEKVRVVVEKLDKVERALGLKTFELLRRGPQTMMPLRMEPPEPATVGQKGEHVPITCSYLNCRILEIETCPACSKPFCSKHIDPAIHPCGDLML